MRAGEGCRGSLAGSMGALYHVVEQSILITRTGQSLHVVHEIVTHVREDALGYLIEADGSVIVLRSGDRQEHKDDIIEHERCHEYPCRAHELTGTAEEEIEHHHQHHGEIAGIAEVHEFADDRAGHGLREEQGGLATEELLLPGGKQMVEIGEDAVELIGVGIPPREQRHLPDNAQKTRHAAGKQAVDHPQRRRHGHKMEPAPQHGHGIDELGPREKNHDQREQHVGQHHPLEGEQPPMRILLYGK